MALAMGRRGEEMLLLTGSFDKTVKVWVRRAEPGASVAATAKTFDGGNQGGNQGGKQGGKQGGHQGGNHGGSQGGSWVLEHTLLGHTDGVLAVELSRQRRLAYSGANDGVVRVWGLQRGECLFVMQQHAKGVTSISQHLASGCLVTGSEDGTVCLWDTANLVGPEERPSARRACDMHIHAHAHALCTCIDVCVHGTRPLHSLPRPGEKRGEAAHAPRVWCVPPAYVPPMPPPAHTMRQTMRVATAGAAALCECARAQARGGRQQRGRHRRRGAQYCAQRRRHRALLRLGSLAWLEKWPPRRCEGGFSWVA